MTYYNSRIFQNRKFNEIRDQVIEALKTEGFGVLTEIDIKETMKKKLDKDYLPHVILGACNPVYADKVLSIDAHVSTMLPCNVTIRELPSGEIEIASINPDATMSSLNIPELAPLAQEVQQKLKKVIRAL
jgi:uncharacterized protein (DUF302 family)